MSDPGAPSPLVSAGWLEARLGEPDLRVVDLRWYLDGRSGEQVYLEGHIPGAVRLDVDRDLASPRGAGRPGRHPLPSPAALAESLGRAGIGPRTRVVAYDDDGGSLAARLWWLARYFHHPAQVQLLDGGLQAWTVAGSRPLEAGEVKVPPCPPLALRPGGARLFDRARVQVLSEQGGGVLLDARAAPRFEGTVEPIDARAGHIPGARSAPYAENLEAPRGRFLSPESLRARYERLGAGAGREVVVYCGSGVTACHDILALAMAGIDAALYEGSWSDWSAEPSLPIEVGGGR